MTLRVTAAPVFSLAALRFGVWPSGTTPPTSFSDIINFDKVEITPPKQETVKLMGRASSNLGVVLDSQQMPTDQAATVTLSANTLTPAMLALALGATVTEVAATTTAVVDEAVTLALNVWVPLANRHIAPHGTGTEIVLETDGTPDVEIASTKYEVDTDGGYVRAIHADAVGAKQISYHTQSRTDERYAAGAAVSQYVMIDGYAEDRVTGYKGALSIYRTRLAASSAFDPASGKHLSVELSGDLILPTVSVRGRVPSAPWDFHIRSA